MLRNSCDIQYRVILVLHHNLLLVNVHFFSTRCAFFLLNLFFKWIYCDWYIYWHLHHYRHGKFTGTVWKYWNLGLQTSEAWQIVTSATNLFWYITKYWALIFTTWPRDTQTPHIFRWGRMNITFQPGNLKFIYI